MNAFAINSASAFLSPFSIRWIHPQIGVDHAGVPILSAKRQIEMQFEGGSVTHARQWLEACSTGSFTLDTLDKWGLNYVTLSGVTAQIVEYPAIESLNHGTFSILITNA